MFVTTRAEKAQEAERLGFRLERLDISLPEPQALDPSEVVAHKARAAYDLLSRPVLVEDTGLAVHAWNGFPGAFVKWLETSAGIPALPRMLDVTSRTPKVVFACQECGAQSPKWVGKCPECGNWNTMVEEREVPQLAGAGAAAASRYAQFSPSSTARLYADVETANAVRLSTGIGEFDRVLGGGVVPGSLVLLGGEPGIGKSTLLLQAAAHFARDVGPVLYASAKEYDPKAGGTFFKYLTFRLMVIEKHDGQWRPVMKGEQPAYGDFSGSLGLLLRIVIRSLPFASAPSRMRTMPASLPPSDGPTTAAPAPSPKRMHVVRSV